MCVEEGAVSGPEGVGREGKGVASQTCSLLVSTSHAHF